METNKKRWLWVDIVKGVASLSIVLAHTTAITIAALLMERRGAA